MGCHMISPYRSDAALVTKTPKMAVAETPKGPAIQMPIRGARGVEA